MDKEGAKRHVRKESLSIHQVLMIVLVVREVTKKQAFSTQVLARPCVFHCKKLQGIIKCGITLALEIDDVVGS